MNREVAIGKVQRLRALAENNENAFEADTSNKMAETIIVRYEISPEELLTSTGKYKPNPGMFVRKMKVQRHRLIQLKMWCLSSIRKGRYLEEALRFARWQGEIEELIAIEELRVRRRAPMVRVTKKGDLNRMRARYS